MMIYKTEAEVINAIKTRLTDAGGNGRVSFFKDEQPGNSETRTSVFALTISMDKSEAIVNKMCDIGTDTDRGIIYRGSQAEPTNEGELRKLFFEAKINPYEE